MLVGPHLSENLLKHPTSSEKSARLPIANPMGWTALALLALCACSSSTEPTVRCSNGEVIPLSVLGATANPTFVWASACVGWRLTVDYVDSNSTVVPVWTFTSPGATNVIHSPIAYGDVPPGVDVTVAAVPLVPGRGYRVEVSGWDAAHSVISFIGLMYFTH